MHTVTPAEATLTPPTAPVRDAEVRQTKDVINGAIQLALSPRHPVDRS